MPTRVAILDDYQGVALSMADWSSLGPGVSLHPFHERIGSEDELAERLRTFDVIVAMRERTPFPASLIERLPSLKLRVTTGRRNAAIDVKAANARGIVVSGTGTLPMPPVELTWGLILSLARRIPLESIAMRSGAWQTTVGVGLHGKTLGVIGLGRLGSDVARIGKAFGMNVIAWSQNLTREKTDPLDVERIAASVAGPSTGSGQASSDGAVVTFLGLVRNHNLGRGVRYRLHLPNLARAAAPRLAGGRQQR